MKRHPVPTRKEFNQMHGIGIVCGLAIMVLFQLFNIVPPEHIISIPGTLFPLGTGFTIGYIYIYRKRLKAEKAKLHNTTA